MRLHTLSILIVSVLLAAAACGDDAPTDAPATNADGGGSSSGGGGADGGGSGTDASTAADTGAGGDAGHAYVMTTYKMWRFDLSDPGQHTEIAPGMVGDPSGTYGTLGIYEPFDVSPDGQHVAILRGGMLHIQDLSNLGAEVSVAADAWASAPRFTDDSQKVRWVRRLRTGGGRFTDVAIVEVPLAGGSPTVVKALPDAAFHTDLDRYVWKWDGSAIVGQERLTGAPDNTSKAHGVVTIDVASGAAALHTTSYGGASFFSFAQFTQEPSCSGAVCITTHDGCTGENNGSFTAESAHFLPDGRIYFTSNRDQFVKGGAGSGARKYLVDTVTPGNYETLPEHTGDRPIAYTRDGARYAAYVGTGGAATIKIARADGTTLATLTGFNTANVPTSVRFGP